MKPSTFLLPAVLVFLCNISLTKAQRPSSIKADSLRADSFLQVASALNRIDKQQEALLAAKEAYKIYSNLYGSNNKQTARSQMFIARALKNLDQNEEALKLFQSSLAFFERTGDTKQIALAHFHISLILRTYRRLEDSRTHLSYAIQLMSKDSVNNAYWLAMLNLSMAFLLNIENKYDEAIPVLDACKSFYTENTDSLILGQIYYHYGNAWYGLQDFERSKENFLASFNYLKNQLTRDNSSFADLLVMLGFCYQKLGEPEIGGQYIAMANQYFDQLAHSDSKYISNLEDLGIYYSEEGKYEQALHYLEQCFAEVEHKFGPTSIRCFRHLPALGAAYLNAGKFTQAESCYRQALQIVADSFQGNHPEKPRYFEKLAEISFAQGNYTESLTLCDSAFWYAGFDIRQPEKMLPRQYARELCLQYGKASYQLYLQTKDFNLLSQSNHSFEKAASILGQEIQDIRADGSREVFYDRDHEVLEQWLDTEMKLYTETGEKQYAEKAFQISGQQKSFLLYDAMRKSNALHVAGLPDSILKQELDLRQGIVESEKSLDDNAFNRPLQDSSRLQIGSTLTEQRKAYDTLLQKIEHNYPEYKQLRFSPSNLSIAELQKQWLAPAQGILMYSLTQTNVYLFILTRDTFCVKSFPIVASMISELDQYRKGITAYFLSNDASDTLYNQSLEQYTALAQSLYQRWIKPVAALLPERLVIIPEGKLCNLPFETLLTASPKDGSNFQTYPFWAKEKAISYCFSTDLWVEMSKPCQQKATQNWLGIAPYADASNTLAGLNRSAYKEQLPALPFSGQEVSAIARLVHGQTWLNNEAGPERFQQEAHAYRILHLATHSHADDRHGNYSYLATSATGQPMPARALYQLSLPAEMVVLSACESAEGYLNRGEGIIGLVRGFAYAGARSVVASTWLADDRSTATLMQDFYQNLMSGQPKDIALKNARIQFLKEVPEAAHPFYWAGFRLYGQVGALWN